MSEDASTLSPRTVATATAIAIVVAAAAVVIYLLLDVVMLLFIGIVLAAALQPWHVELCDWGIPRGAAVLVIYLLPLVWIALIMLTVVPVVSEQIGAMVGELPGSYEGLRAWLQQSGSGALRMLGDGLPSRESLAPVLSGVAPKLAEGTLGVTTTIVMLPAYLLTVLAIGFYWTMELPQLERLVLSLVDVERRPAALNVWHEIEFRLGGYLRAQLLVMVFIGAASGIGYALIGLPNALVLGVLAGLLEAVPFVGPLAALVPAVLVALPLGADSVLLVFLLVAVVQTVESNVLIPRIMQSAVGVSSLVSILSLLAFATLYGMLGVLIAIPVAAVIQVLIDTLVLHPAPSPAALQVEDEPGVDLRTRVAALQERARERIRARTNRMGIDPTTADHVLDAIDQQLELRFAHLARVMDQAAVPPQAEARCVARLQAATGQVEDALRRAEDAASPLPGSCLRELERTLQRFRTVVREVEAVLTVREAAGPSTTGAAA